MRSPPTELLQGIAEFNRQEYFRAHETLERLWRRERGPIRLFYQGIIQIAVGLLHAQRGNNPGAIGLLGRGIDKLDSFAPACLGVDVAGLLADARQARDAILARREDNIGGLPAGPAPVIRMTDSGPRPSTTP